MLHLTDIMFAYYSSLRNPIFRRFFLSTLLYRAGSAVLTILFPWLVLELTGSYLQLGISFALTTAPDLFIYPIAGILTDRLSRKRLMIVGSLTKGASGMIIFACLYSSALTVILLYSLIALNSMASVVFVNARYASMPVFIEDEELDNANSLIYFSMSMTSMLSFLLGGTIVSIIGINLPFLISSVFFFLSAFVVSILKVRLDKENTSPINFEGIWGKFKSIRSELKVALNEILGTRLLKLIIWYGAVINIATASFGQLTTVIAWRYFDSIIAYSLLLSVFTGGKMVGSLMVNKINIKNSRERTFVIGILITGSVSLALGISGIIELQVMAFGKLALMVTSVLLLFIGLGETVFNVPADTLVQTNARDEVRGKVTSFEDFLLTLPMPIISLTVGFLVNYISPYIIFSGSGVILLFFGYPEEKR